MRWGYYHADRNDVRQAARSLEDFASGTAAGMITMSTYPYIIATAIRELVTDSPCVSCGNRNIDKGILTGFSIGILGFLGQGALYATHPNLLALPIATNIVSGIYEGVRGLRQRSIAKKKEIFRAKLAESRGLR